MKSEYKKLKEKAWLWCSMYIRYRDCLETTGTDEYGRCCTCGKVYPFKDLQAGHFIDGRNNAILFEEQGIHAQCKGCNIFKHGNKIEYYEFMLYKYGQEAINNLKAKATEVKKLTKDDLLKLIDYFKDKINQLGV